MENPLFHCLVIYPPILELGMGQNILPYFGGSTSTSYDFRYCLGTTLLTIGKKENMLLSSIPLYPHLYPMVTPQVLMLPHCPLHMKNPPETIGKRGWNHQSSKNAIHRIIIMEIFVRIFWQIIRTNLHWDHQNPSTFKKYNYKLLYSSILLSI